jgi:hypothetical protein
MYDLPIKFADFSVKGIQIFNEFKHIPLAH